MPRLHNPSPTHTPLCTQCSFYCILTQSFHHRNLPLSILTSSWSTGLLMPHQNPKAAINKNLTALKRWIPVPVWLWLATHSSSHPVIYFSHFLTRKQPRKRASLPASQAVGNVSSITPSSLSWLWLTLPYLVRILLASQAQRIPNSIVSP